MADFTGAWKSKWFSVNIPQRINSSEYPEFHIVWKDGKKYKGLIYYDDEGEIAMQCEEGPYKGLAIGWNVDIKMVEADIAGVRSPFPIERVDH